MPFSIILSHNFRDRQAESFHILFGIPGKTWTDREIRNGTRSWKPNLRSCSADRPQLEDGASSALRKCSFRKLCERSARGAPERLPLSPQGFENRSLSRIPIQSHPGPAEQIFQNCSPGSDSAVPARGTEEEREDRPFQSENAPESWTSSLHTSDESVWSFPFSPSEGAGVTHPSLGGTLPAAPEGAPVTPFDTPAEGSP